MVIGTIADTLTRGVENVTDSLSGTFGEPVIRLGVTGLSRAGKTVFITSLVANLLDRGRMPQLAAESEGRILAAFLQPQPDDTMPRFDYETHLGALTARTPHWPDSTRAISQLRLSLKVRPTGLLAGLSGARRVHVDIVDYPGEWLLDLGLMDKSYAEWSAETLARMQERPGATEFLAMARNEDAARPFEETRAKALAASFTSALHRARDAGYSDCTPGRFLLPGEKEGSAMLTFAPLPDTGEGRRRSVFSRGAGSLADEMARRFEAYKREIVRPFFRDHFSRIDRQVVLVDALGAIHAGPAAVEDLRRTMAEILGAFRPGSNAFLRQVLMGKRVEKILFAATKADHLHHTQHARLTGVMQALTREAADRAQFSGAETQAMSIAALRATVEETITHQGQALECVRGTLLNDDGTRGRQAAFHPGELPEDPGHLLRPARDGAKAWLDGDYSIMRFAPAPLTLKPGEGPPHIRLDRAAQVLIGDRL
ncbi:YcjX family protein [Salipiger mucosus]|uniref:Amino acid regulated cytosolic protein n=1 Tax=Salipiger mucosus DSM 16094 TaxID=1123237 RepID=S9QQY4_9RHOB|nr:YcjX family protein [Salipiger mucosus]EPX82052.1 amino acid regulated cytosolic protein [Salipiger mucosus DSM 16094]